VNVLKKVGFSNQIRSVTTHTPSNPQAKSRNFESIYKHNTQTHLQFASVEVMFKLNYNNV